MKALYNVLSLVLTLFLCTPLLALEEWQAIPMNAHGGEGCQVIQAIAVAPTDGNLLLMGTDVSGMFRSTDGGANWKPANLGFTPRGVSDIVFDPRNKNRALAIGGNQSAQGFHGVYRSTNQGVSWTSEQTLNIKGYRDIRRQLAYARSSYNSSLGYCTTAYWSSGPVTGGSSALYKTTDGGNTWSVINSNFGNCVIAVHPGNGNVYAGKSDGLYKSTNGGSSFTQILAKNIKSIDVVSTDVNRVVVGSTEPKIYVSTNSGNSFSTKNTSGIPSDRSITSLAVNPQNVNHILVSGTKSGAQILYRSTNGGGNFSKPNIDTTGKFVNDSNRNTQVVWHPNGNTAYTWTASVNVIRSTNGGANFSLRNKGNLGLAVAGAFHFNAINPDIVFYPAVDFNGAQTTNGGSSWKRMNGMDQQNTGSGVFGWVRGGYSVDANIIYGAAAEDANHYRPDFRRTTNRASSWTTINYNNLNVQGGNGRIHSSYGDPKNANICFYYRYRSTDKGATWSGMSNVRAVLGHDPTNDALIGTRSANNKSYIVRSTNSGASWSTVAGSEYGTSWFEDVAYDHVNGYYYAVTNTRDRLIRFNVANQSWQRIEGRVPKDQRNNRIFWTVATDPVNPSVVYVGGARGNYRVDTAVCRSTDAGATFRPLTRSPRHNNSQFGMDGGSNATWIRVHPVTRDAWVATNTNGLWKIGAPGGGGGGSSSSSSGSSSSSSSGSTSHKKFSHFSDK